jgi:aromatic ring hydroxylase
MALKKGEDYIASLKSLKLEANVMGKKTRDLPDHPLVTPSVRAVASTFDCAYRKETRDLFNKFRQRSGVAFKQDEIERIIDFILPLEKLKDLNEFLGGLRKAYS